MSEHTVYSGGKEGVLLKFPDNETYRRYERDILRVNLAYYREVRAKWGVWASNQNKFVRSVEDFNDLDSRHMEQLSQREPL